jgi:hypothetical protein
MTIVDLTVLGERLRSDERAAREALDRGCAADLAAFAQFARASLRTARAAVQTCVLSTGPVDLQLRRHVLATGAADAAVTCARAVFANAGLRVRARFAMYADALAAAERRFIDDARGALGDDGARLRAQRRIAIASVECEDERSVVPSCELTASSLDAWSHELESRIRVALASEVERGRRALLKRGSASLARTRVALRLAARREHLVL